MSSPDSPAERHIALLRARKDAVERLLTTSAELRAALDSDDDVAELLDRRDHDCRLIASLTREDAAPMLSVSKHGSRTPDAVTLYREIEQLSRQVLACQAECEAIMKARLDALASAIRESVQRRKLGAAYGPTSGQDQPLFLDKQQ